MTNVQVPMNEAQIELLKLFASGLQEHQMKALKQMLISFQFRLLEEEVEKAAKEKNITDADVEKALHEHWRTCTNKPSDFAGIWKDRPRVDAQKLRQRAWKRNSP